MSTSTTFSSMAAVKAANQAAGHHYFDRDAMRFFNSEIESSLYGGRFFITSERMELDMPKRYSVRFARPTGTIEDVGEFQQFETLDEAKWCAKVCSAPRATAIVRFDPYPSHADLAEGDADSAHFHWRPWIGGPMGAYPVGNRTSHSAAEQLARELV